MALIPSPRHPAASAADPVRPRGLETLSRLADKLAGSDSALVVDAETAGRVLGVTARTARRLLHGLVEEGLAWPLPPSRAPQPGRPAAVLPAWSPRNWSAAPLAAAWQPHRRADGSRGVIAFGMRGL